MKEGIVGWAERSEPHHNPVGLRMVGLAALGPFYKKALPAAIAFWRPRIYPDSQRL